MGLLIRLRGPQRHYGRLGKAVLEAFRFTSVSDLVREGSLREQCIKRQGLVKSISASQNLLLTFHYPDDPGRSVSQEVILP